MADQNLTGKLLSGRYRVEKLLARGGMASVFLAEDERLERQVAIKVIYQHLAEDEAFRAKFLREAKMAAKLSHPNIVNIFDQGQDEDVLYLAMEYVPSITLRDALKQFGAIPPRRALELFELMLQGLAAAHDKNILHRDIKPENVFLADDGRIKLGDFGLAREVDSHTSTGSLVGTIAYLSPELITRGKADARSDVYAAGIMLFEMLTGEQPYQGTEAAHIAHQHTAAQMPLPSSKNPKVPALIDELVLWATARNPSHRPADAGELLEVAQRVMTELKQGRADTTKLDVLENAKTKIYSGEDLRLDDATTVLDDQPSLSDDATQDFADLGLIDNATERLEALTSSDTNTLGRFAARRRRRSKILFGLIPLLALLSGLAGYLINGGITTIPDLKNRSLEQALTALEPLGGNLTQSEVNDKLIPAGKVIGTNPPSGTLFWRGQDITLLVSKGPKLIAVPSLNGLGQQSAADSLSSAGFTLGTVYQSFSPATKDQVYAHTGDDGALQPEGSAINLEVSLGPIPSLSGQTESEANRNLAELQLSITETLNEYSDSVPKGFVIRIEPVQNPLRIGGEVVLVLSKGPTTVVMPQVIGETLTAAKKLLEGLGLKVQVNTDQLTANWGIVKVKSVSAKAGSTVRIGDTVTISNK